MHASLREILVTDSRGRPRVYTTGCYKAVSSTLVAHAYGGQPRELNRPRHPWIASTVAIKVRGKAERYT